MFWKNSKTKKRICAALAVMLAVTSFTEGAFAKTTHDELDYYLEVRGKRTTITVKPNDTEDGTGNNYVVSPDSAGTEGVNSAFTVERAVGDEVEISSGSANSAYIDHLSESDDSEVNVTGFRYRFGVEGETVTVHWKLFNTYFNGNGGTSGAGTVTTEYNQENSMPNASRSNYSFEGWYTEASGGSKVGGNGTTYTQTASEPTYYAHWKCLHPDSERTASYSAWVNHSATQHKHTKTVKCKVCGATVSTSTEYGNHSDGNKDGKCDGCGVAFKTASIALYWIPKTAATAGAAYGNQKAAHDKGKKQKTWTCYPADSEPSPGDWSVKGANSTVSSTWSFVGWVADNSIQGWKTVNGNPNTTITSKPSMYKHVADAVGKTTKLFAVYKRNSGNYWVVSGS